MMMKSNLNIKKIVSDVLKEHISQKEMISEAPKLSLGIGAIRDLIKKFESSYGDDLARIFERLIEPKGPIKNIRVTADKQVFLKSAKGTPVPLSQIEDAVDLIASGKMNLDDAAKLLPRQLADGTEFRSVLVKSLNKSKPLPLPLPSPTLTREVSATKEFLQGMKISALDYLRRIPWLEKKMSEVYYKQLEPLKSLESRFNQIMNEIGPKITAGNTFEIDNEIKEINKILSQFTAKANIQQQMVFETWINALPKDLQAKLSKIENQKFNEFYTYFTKKISESSKSAPPSLTMSKMRAAKLMFTPGKKGYLGNLNQFRKRLGNTILFLDARTLEEVKGTLLRYGKSRGWGKEFGDKLIASIVFWPLILSVGQVLLDYLENALGYDLPIANDKYVRENRTWFNNYLVDNLLNFVGNYSHDVYDKSIFGTSNLLKIQSWSPAAYALGLTFFGGKKQKLNKIQLKDLLDKGKKDAENTKVEIKDTLKNNPELSDSLRKIEFDNARLQKIWDGLFIDSESTTTNTVTPTNTTPTNTTIPGQTSWKLSDTSKTKVAPKF